MKKVIAFVMAMAMVCSMAVAASAADTTTLTTTVPAATYTLNIPADQEIPFGTATKTIGNVTITDSTNFAVGKNIEVTIEYDECFSSSEVTTTIPYIIKATATARTSGGSYGSGGSTTITETKSSGSIFTFKGLSNGKCNEFFVIEKSGWGTDESTIGLYVDIDSTSWGKALAGEYSSTITFTAKVVSAG